MRVALFVTCFNDTMFPESAKATIELLERLGVEVDFPMQQTCCGQMHINTGYRREALPLVRRYVEVFDGYDAVVAPSASCAGTVQHYHHKIAVERGDAALQDGVARVAPRTYELTQFLTDVLGVEDVGRTSRIG
jgi:L-lactate dehydrogenase complex protein LldE